MGCPTRVVIFCRFFSGKKRHRNTGLFGQFSLFVAEKTKTAEYKHRNKWPNPDKCQAIYSHQFGVRQLVIFCVCFCFFSGKTTIVQQNLPSPCFLKYSKNCIFPPSLPSLSATTPTRSFMLGFISAEPVAQSDAFWSNNWVHFLSCSPRYPPFDKISWENTAGSPPPRERICCGYVAMNL